MTSPTATADLIEFRLRNIGEADRQHEPPMTWAEAAELLAALRAAEAEREAAQYELARFKEANAARPDWEQLWSEATERAEAAEAERDAAVAGLRDVCEPLGYLKRKAEAQGCALNGYAHTLINQASFLQDIARAALQSTSAKEGK